MFRFLFQLASAGTRCDYGLYLGASADNYSTVKDLAHLSAGLKMYLNETFTTLRLDDMSTWMKVSDSFRKVRIPEGDQTLTRKRSDTTVKLF